MAKNPKYASHITPAYIDDIYQSSILHDIGKVGVPDAVLLKPGKLTDEEFEVIKRHTSLGGDAIKAIESQIEGQSFLALGKEIAYNHHEKWDGSGYPEGLAGERIPLSARIIALADVYDALTTRRNYKEAYSHKRSRQIIIDLKETHFDPELVDVFITLEDEFNRIRRENQENETENWS
jgi:response regulator RpfG family c-di-GMP phosphodiesterase